MRKLDIKIFCLENNLKHHHDDTTFFEHPSGHHQVTIVKYFITSEDKIYKPITQI